KADRDVSLRDVAKLGRCARCELRGLGGDPALRPSARHPAKPPRDRAPHARGIDVARDDERDIVGDVVAAKQLDDVTLAEPARAIAVASSASPLNSMCSTTCATPAWRGPSSAEPTPTHACTATTGDGWPPAMCKVSPLSRRWVSTSCTAAHAAIAANARS